MLAPFPAKGAEVAARRGGDQDPGERDGGNVAPPDRKDESRSVSAGDGSPLEAPDGPPARVCEH